MGDILEFSASKNVPKKTRFTDLQTQERYLEQADGIQKKSKNGIMFPIRYSKGNES